MTALYHLMKSNLMIGRFSNINISLLFYNKNAVKLEHGHCDPVTYDLILIGRRGLVMDYLCGKFGDCCFSRFGFIVQTDTHTHTETPLNALDRDCRRRE